MPDDLCDYLRRPIDHRLRAITDDEEPDDDDEERQEYERLGVSFDPDDLIEYD